MITREISLTYAGYKKINSSRMFIRICVKNAKYKISEFNYDVGNEIWLRSREWNYRIYRGREFPYFLEQIKKAQMPCKFVQRINKKTLKCLKREYKNFGMFGMFKLKIQSSAGNLYRTVRTLHQLNVVCNIISCIFTTVLR